MQNTNARRQQAAPRRAMPDFPPEFQAEPYLKMDEPALLKILKDPNATVFQKNVACRRLAVIGTKQSVPVLAAMLSDEKLAHYARYGIKPVPDPSVDDALRAALPKLKGKLLVGVINTIGNRRDAKAVDPLARMLSDSDTEVAVAAALSLGCISGPHAAKVLQDGLRRTKGPVRKAVADACLVCAERLQDAGDRKGAAAMYDMLSRADMPKTVRLAAMHATILGEAPLRREK